MKKLAEGLSSYAQRILKEGRARIGGVAEVGKYGGYADYDEQPTGEGRGAAVAEVGKYGGYADYDEQPVDEARPIGSAPGWRPTVEQVFERLEARINSATQAAISEAIASVRQSDTGSAGLQGVVAELQELRSTVADAVSGSRRHIVSHWSALS